MQPKNQQQYMDYIIPHAGGSRHFEDMYAKLDRFVAGFPNYSLDHPKSADHFRSFTEWFIVAVGGFCLGRLDSVKYIFKTVPPQEWPVDLLTKDWGEQHARRFLKNFGTVRDLIYALRDLTPFPDDQFDTENLELIQEWFVINREQLLWDDEQKRYFLDK